MDKEWAPTFEVLCYRPTVKEVKKSGIVSATRAFLNSVEAAPDPWIDDKRK